MYFSHIVGGLGYPCIIVGIWSHNLGANFPSLKDLWKISVQRGNLSKLQRKCQLFPNRCAKRALLRRVGESHDPAPYSANTTLYVCLIWLRSGVELVLAHLYKVGVGCAASPCRHKLYCLWAKINFRQKSCSPSYRK